MPGFGTLGVGQFGDKVFAEVIGQPVVIDQVDSGGQLRTAIGFYESGRRGYARPEESIPRTISADPTEQVAITITNNSGDLLGKIRSDVEKSIIQSIEFTDGRRGSMDFKLKLNKLPDFPILPFSIVKMRIGNSTFNWYSGVIDYSDDLGTEKDFFEFRGRGLSQYTSVLRGEKIHLAGTDIGEIVNDIALNELPPFSPIKYNEAKINQITGVVIVNDIDLSLAFIDKILDTLALMANHRWGVDGDGETYFEPVQGTLQRTFFVGFTINQFEPKLNLQEVKNSITVLRQEGKASGAAGWIVGGIFNDLTSVGKYGKKEENFQVPGFFDTDEVNLVGNGLLRDKAEPQISADAKGFIVQSQSDFLTRGEYRFILPINDYARIVSDVDDILEWQKIGVGDLVISMDTTKVVHGNSSLKMLFTAATNDRAEFTGNVKGAIQKVRFYIRSNRVGSFATVGIGLTNFNEHTVKLDLPVSDGSFLFEWDISSLNIKEINKFAIQIDEDFGSPVELFVDKLEVIVTGFRLYRVPYEKATYKFSPNSSTANIQFGILPPKMENYLKNLFATAEELRFAGEIR